MEEGPVIAEAEAYEISYPLKGAGGQRA